MGDIFENGFSSNSLFETFINCIYYYFLLLLLYYYYIAYSLITANSNNDKNNSIILPTQNSFNTFYTNIIIDDRHMNIGDNMSLTNRDVLLPVKYIKYIILYYN